MSTVREYAGLVDANVLCYLWPKELDKYRCVVCGCGDVVYLIYVVLYYVYLSGYQYYEYVLTTVLPLIVVFVWQGMYHIRIRVKANVFVLC